MTIYEAIVFSFLPVLFAVGGGSVHYCLWKKQYCKNLTNGNKEKDSYSPSLLFYRFGAGLGIVTASLYFVFHFIPTLLKDTPIWEDIVLRFGIIAGTITILAILAKMMKED